MEKWGTFQVAYGHVNPMGEKLFEYKATYDKFKAYRSEIIEAALFIESRLDALLCYLFVDNDPVRFNLFRTYVLGPESGSFFQKWKMLKAAIPDNAPLPLGFSKDERKKLLSEMSMLINDRNAFAHGDLYVDARDGRPFLKYFQQKEKELYLDDGLINGILERARGIHWRLESLISFRSQASR
jgi:hypothetical protein